MSDSPGGKKSREGAYKRVTDVLGVLRKQWRLGWDMVLDLTRNVEQWETYESARDARAQLRRQYTEDRWLGQPYYPVLIIEKDTMEPVCEPIAQAWQMPFASSRGYSSLRLQHDVAMMLRRRQAKTRQRAIVYFISDHDPSGLDLQRAWEQALEDFGIVVAAFVRIGLTRQQVARIANPRLRPGIEVKESDTRSADYIAEHGDRCWETDILPAAVIEAAISAHIASWLDRALWERRGTEIERARELL
jgi:hypothetical protein